MRGAVAAGHRLTAEAGAQVLAEGGNAVDARIAAAFVSWVAEESTSPPAGVRRLHAVHPWRAHLLDARARPLRRRSRARSAAAGRTSDGTRLMSTSHPSRRRSSGSGRPRARFRGCRRPRRGAPPLRLHALAHAAGARDRTRPRGRRADRAAGGISRSSTWICVTPTRDARCTARMASASSPATGLASAICFTLEQLAEKAQTTSSRASSPNALSKHVREGGGALHHAARPARVPRHPAVAGARALRLRVPLQPAAVHRRGADRPGRDLLDGRRRRPGARRRWRSSSRSCASRSPHAAARSRARPRRPRDGLRPAPAGRGREPHPRPAAQLSAGLRIPVVDARGTRSSPTASTGAGSVIVLGTGSKPYNMLGEFLTRPRPAASRGRACGSRAEWRPRSCSAGDRPRLVVGSAGRCAFAARSLRQIVVTVAHGLGIEEALSAVHLEATHAHAEGGNDPDELDRLESVGPTSLGAGDAATSSAARPGSSCWTTARSPPPATRGAAVTASSSSEPLSESARPRWGTRPPSSNSRVR